MTCPDMETLIAFAMNPLAAENDALAEHIHGCPACRLNLRLANESLLAPDWVPTDAMGDRPAGPAADPARLAQYIHVLEHDMKDRHGRWLRKGAEVLVDPEDPTWIEAATDEMKRRFVANGFGFLRNLPLDTVAALKRIGAEINRFGPAIDRNMAGMRGRSIPGLNLPRWVNFVPAPFRVTFGTCEELKVDRLELARWLADHGQLPRPETLGAESRKALEDANFFRVYELRSHSIRFRVFAVYVTPVDCATLKVRAADIDVYRSVKDFIHQWGENEARANCKCYILGSSRGWPLVPPVVLTDGVGVLCSPDPRREGAWCVSHPDLASFRSVFRSFVYGLYPETEEMRLTRVKAVLGLYGSSGATSSVVAEKTGLPVELVEQAFDALHADAASGYENYRTVQGMSAMRRASGVKRSCFFRRRTGVGLFHLAKLVLLVMTAFGGEFGRQYVASGAVKFGIYAVCLSVILITYAQSCFEGFCKRILEK